MPKLSSFDERQLPDGTCDLELTILEAGALAAALDLAREHLLEQAALGSVDSAKLAAAMSRTIRKLEASANARWSPETSDASERS